jgi:hypothetical protein
MGRLPKYVTIEYVSRAHLRVVLSCARAGVLTREFMQLHTITHVDQLAVCNDGSPGAYYHRNGAVDNSTRYATREQMTWQASAFLREDCIALAIQRTGSLGLNRNQHYLWDRTR